VNHKIKIIGGQWRSRQIEVLDAQGLRPTPSRVRETLFNWLQADIVNSNCLDLFAGSGALSFEALSRGAKTVVQIESNPLACQVLRKNAQTFATSNVKLQQTDAFEYLTTVEPKPFDIVFVDPPFLQGFVLQSCDLLQCKGWLAGHTKVYIESEHALELTTLSSAWHLLKHKRAGDVTYRLFEFIVS
jgi:16S rRNA (guanine966-N2)-methyltransferase